MYGSLTKENQTIKNKKLKSEKHNSILCDKIYNKHKTKLTRLCQGKKKIG